MEKFIPVAEPSIDQKDISYVTDAVKSGWVSSLGEYIIRFEKGFAEYCSTKYALSTMNGTAALHLVLASLGIGEGDEVIVPDLTFVATVNAVAYTGATPIFADVDTETWCLDPEDTRKKITDKTRAIIPVHLYGHPADMDAINGIAKKYDLDVIEDAAEAHGSECYGKKVGSMGQAGIFSFYGNKTITTGEGGMITTNNKELYEKAKFLRDHAMSEEKRYWHTEVGYNYRITNLQAALGVAQLERIDAIIEKKIQIFTWYKELLSDVDVLQLNPEAPWAKNTYWMICALLDENTKATRTELEEQLKSAGIDSRPFFYPTSSLPMYKNANTGKNLVTEDVSRRGINLPSGVNLTKNDVKRICSEIRKILNV